MNTILSTFHSFSKTIACLLLSLSYLVLNGQTTIKPVVKHQDNNWTIESISIEGNSTIVRIHIPSQSREILIPSETILSWDDMFSVADAKSISLDRWDGTWIYRGSRLSNDKRAELINYFDANGLLLRKADNVKLDLYALGPKTKAEKRAYGKKNYSPELDITLYFDALPKGIETLYIKTFAYTSSYSSATHNDKLWEGIRINNPWPESMIVDASDIYKLIDSQNDGIVGVYEGTNAQGNGYTLACIKDKDNYKIVFMNSKKTEQYWHRGEVKCVLYPSATRGLFKGDWYMRNKQIAPNCFVTFNGSFMSAMINGTEERYVKMYPIAGSSSPSTQWSGTGFAMNGNLIVTNHHVIDGASSIKVIGVNGDHNTEYNAAIVAKDKNNDLAIIKLEEANVSGIPYTVSFDIANVGQEIFVLGYPLISTMGEEIKYTSGSISSKSGFEGDLSTYQISAPIQPGNSGGPLFDSRGNIIGIVNAKHTGAENAGYALKTTFLKALIENSELSEFIPHGNLVPQGDRAKQIDVLRNFVYLIKCSGSE